MELIFLIICVFAIPSGYGLNLTRGPDDGDDSKLDVVQLITKYGYPVETYTTETEDGYFLQLHRIPHGKNNSNGAPRIPLLMLHGLCGSSEFFLLLGPDSFPFLAADDGYDVWLGNLRGSLHGKGHRSLAPDNDKFWDFSWHESGVYDLPAIIDFTCNYTGQKKIMYLGISMGSTIYFAMASLRPDYLNKVQGAVMWSPVATIGHLINPDHTSSNLSIQSLGGDAVRGRITRDSSALKIFLRKFCGLFSNLCKEALFILSGTEPSRISKNTLSLAVKYFPGSSSWKTLIHYFQSKFSGKFRQYDYGKIKNLIRYNSTEPPEYDLRSATTPMSLFMAQHDIFVWKGDKEFLLKHLPNLVGVYLVDSKTFTHADFIVANDAKELTYYKTLEELHYLSEITQ